MKYRVSGVDRKSGRDAMVTVEAPDAQRAEAAAMKQLMVAEVEPDDGSGGVATALAREAEDLAESKRIAKGLPLAYAGPRPVKSIDAELPPTSRAAHPSSTIIVGEPPGYDDIPTGANWIRGFAKVVNIAGLLVLIGWPAVSMLTTLTAAVDTRGRDLASVGGAGIASFVLALLTGVVASIPLFALAALLRLIASVSLAIRDMARNSFRR